MLKTSYKVLGVMSGTSLDGIDLAYCTFDKQDAWNFKLHKAETIPYDVGWEQKLPEGLLLPQEDLKLLDQEYTPYLAEVIRGFIEKHDIQGLDAICSHGHTILHRPERGITLQIGNLPEIASMTGNRVVCDFRKQDVALGGQGAPLVPIGDRLLFSEYDYCLNLGGFANVSFGKKGKRVAYDICPVNIVLNLLAMQLGFPYDEGGKIASSGNFLPTLFEQLNNLEFYKKEHPKSLGLEWVREFVFPLLKTEDKVEDKLHTVTEHISVQLARSFSEESSVLITGGGAYNNYLLKRLQSHKNLKVILPSSEVIEYKEAIVFGLLGVLKLRGEINCLASVTGAKKDHASGSVYLP